jgi:hypothetical protein
MAVDTRNEGDGNVLIADAGESALQGPCLSSRAKVDGLSMPDVRAVVLAGIGQDPRRSARGAEKDGDGRKPQRRTHVFNRR